MDGGLSTAASGNRIVGWSTDGRLTCTVDSAVAVSAPVSSSSVGHCGSSGKRASVNSVRAISHPPASAPMRVDRASWSTLVASRMGYMSEDQWSSTS
jgi:hypothetical protein